MTRLTLAPEVIDEIDEAAGFYDGWRRGLSDELFTEITRALDDVEERPRSFPRLRDVPKDLTVRRAQLRRFPFALVFLELPEGQVRVIAFAHMKRRPGYWLSRITG